MDARVQRLGDLFDAYAGAVHLYASRVVDRDADDVVAEVFLVVWRRLDDVPPQHPLPWLLQVTRRVAANARRTSKRQSAVRDALDRQGAGPVRDLGTAAAERALVHDALDTLSVPDREALVLTTWLDLDPTEAARLAGCSAQTFRVRLHRARARLRDALRRLDDVAASADPARNGS